MHNAAQAYGNVAQQTATGRELEAHILLKAARKLQAVREEWLSEESPEALDEALIYNRKLWTVLATSATAAENPLSPAVKQNIGNLAIFIFNRTLDLMVEPSPDKIDALVRINREIAAGLRTIPADEPVGPVS